jgi:hypothetical protein
MADVARDLIMEALSDLHWDFMEEPWVEQAILWLGYLGREAALPVLDEILEEKKFMVLNSWPRAAREAAATAREELRERLSYKSASPKE